MPRKKTKKKKRGKIKISKRAVVKRKNETLGDSIKHAPTIVPSNGIVFKVKVKRK